MVHNEDVRRLTYTWQEIGQLLGFSKTATFARLAEMRAAGLKPVGRNRYPREKVHELLQLGPVH